MTTPTCSQCSIPIVARDAMLVMGQVAIWLQCDNGHDVVEIVPVSRFIPTWEELFDEMNATMAEIKATWQCTKVL